MGSKWEKVSMWALLNYMILCLFLGVTTGFAAKTTGPWLFLVMFVVVITTGLLNVQVQKAFRIAGLFDEWLTAARAAEAQQEKPIQDFGEGMES